MAESRQEVGAAVLGGGLATDVLERTDEVALVVEAARMRDLREEHAGGGEQLDGRVHADRGDDRAVRVLERIDARDDESQFPLYVNLLVIILR